MRERYQATIDSLREQGEETYKDRQALRDKIKVLQETLMKSEDEAQVLWESNGLTLITQIILITLITLVTWREETLLFYRRKHVNILCYLF